MAQLVTAVSERTFQALFTTLRDSFMFSDSGSKSVKSTLTLGYSIKAHLEGGAIDLRADNTVRVSDLAIVCDQLDLSLGINLPKVTLGGQCIVWVPVAGCVLRLPKKDFFGGNPDLSCTLPLGGLVDAKVSFDASLVIRRATNPSRPAGMNAWDAQDQKPSLADHWQVFIHPRSIDLDFKILKGADKLLKESLDAAVKAYLGKLGSVLKKILEVASVSLVDEAWKALGIGGDAEAWVSALFGGEHGIIELLSAAIADYFASRYPLHQIEDPFPIMEGTPGPNSGSPALVSVKVPIQEMKVSNTDVEMILEATVA